ncbi:MAG: hypothetical protein P8J70_00470 [Glaciecola sp.]|jgi:hypothetical protein|nr:hypothetical protein [Glaciecola sp.]MDG1815945.1 hypothetical protein [Glaciecola sp.]MDG2098138.1 hypothetical protein [Glaciecola sp.]
MILTITLLVAITLYGIYYYDKMYSNGERQLIIKKYLKNDIQDIKKKVKVSTKSSKAKAAPQPTPKSAHHAILADIVDNGALIMELDHLQKIISGEHIWELRTTKFKKSGYIGLVEKGSKQICAYAKIAGYHGPLSKEELKAAKSKHGVLAKDYNAKDFKRLNAIELCDVVALPKPITYEHKPGAVIWVKIGEQEAVVKQLKTMLTQ